MLNEFVYCSRLGYLEWVQGEFMHGAVTVDGAIKHRRVDKGGGDLPEKTQEQEHIHARSLSLGSDIMGITAKKESQLKIYRTYFPGLHRPGLIEAIFRWWSILV